jgi:TetR/AcrR family transcriptional regulator of autoinduction and epiphytic fitness
MAQRSKKEHIVGIALPLFLDNGFKGTSIDVVVKKSAVSKPTVYNHFPNKAALMLAVIKQWIESNKPSLAFKSKAQTLDALIQSQWLTDDAVRMYAMVIGEGWRFPEARKIFWEQYDEIWRKALSYVAERSPNHDQTPVERLLDHELMNRLKRL